MSMKWSDIPVWTAIAAIVTVIERATSGLGWGKVAMIAVIIASLAVVLSAAVRVRRDP